MMGVKVASMRLKGNWSDDEWPDVRHVSHVYTPGDWREYVPKEEPRDESEGDDR